MHGQAAGDANYLACYEVRIIAREKRDHSCHVVGLSQTLERDRFCELFEKLLSVITFTSESAEQCCVGWPGTNDIYADIIARAFPGHGLRKSN